MAVDSRHIDHLSHRERSVVQLLAQGRSTVEISAGLGIKPGTVQGYLNHARGKLGVHTREQIVALAREARLGE
jgi:non-specific serine/threonine protein kinase